MPSAEKFKNVGKHWSSMLLQKLAASATPALCKCLMYKNGCVFLAIWGGGGCCL
jgi:hypothetical protein